MTDRSLTPEIYGDFGLFLEQMGFREKRVPKPQEDQKTTDNCRQIETNDWYKQGKECPF